MCMFIQLIRLFSRCLWHSDKVKSSRLCLSVVKLTVFSVVVSLIYTVSLFIMKVIVVCVNRVQCDAMSHKVLYEKCDTWGLSLSVLGLITPDSERPDPPVSDWPQISCDSDLMFPQHHFKLELLHCHVCWCGHGCCVCLSGVISLCSDAIMMLEICCIILFFCTTHTFIYLISIFLFLCGSRLILSSPSWHSSVHAWLPCYSSSN